MKWEDLERELLAMPGVHEEIDRLYPYETVSLELARLRGSYDMTQIEFGRLIGMPQSTVARLESGKQAPSVATLKRIAEATGAELVIEFRRPKRKRRAKRQPTASSSTGDERSTDPLAASGSDD